MGDDFINLDAYSDLDPKSQDDGLQNLDSGPPEAECGINTSQKENIPIGGMFEGFEGIGKDEGSEQAMDLEDDLVQEQPAQDQSVHLVESATKVEKVNELEFGSDGVTGFAVTLSQRTVNRHSVDDSPIAGVKRARQECIDQHPSVRVIYSSLTRESKKKLMELMQQWSEWHTRSQSSSNLPRYTDNLRFNYKLQKIEWGPIMEASKEVLEYGEETFFPALHLGSETSSTVSFWLDTKSRNEDAKAYRVDNDTVPLYDRGCTLGSNLFDDSTDAERIESVEAPRCFNCGSYNHSMKECTKPRDNAAITNARKQHTSKRNQAPGSRPPSRYYQKSPGKFDDLKAGVLGPETRESLGIGELDPPPWLQRMREMGYPPGYLDVVEDENKPSGITIFGSEEKVDYEEGELPEMSELEPPEKKMTVEFPGINAPIPENADHMRWAGMPSGYSGSSSFKNRYHTTPNRASDTQEGPYHDQRWSPDRRDDGHPGAEYPLASSVPSNSPRYGPYDHNQISRSPGFGRSLSDRGWRSPLTHESSPGHSLHSPYPYSNIPRQSPHHSPTIGPENWSHESPYSASPEPSQQSRDRHKHHRHHRR